MYNREVVSAVLGSDMAECCDLRQAVGIQAECDGDACVYWRAVGHLGISAEEAGCAIKNLGMLEEADDDVARWLHSVKQRVEALERAACQSVS